MNILYFLYRKKPVIISTGSDASPGDKDMSNVVVTALTDVEKGVQFVVGLGKKAEAFVAKLEKVIPANLGTEISAFVQDVESFIALASTSATADGLNFTSDSAAYTAFEKVKSDVLSLAVELENAVKQL